MHHSLLPSRPASRLNPLRGRPSRFLHAVFGLLALTALPAVAHEVFYVDYADDTGPIGEGTGAGIFGDLRYCLIKAMAYQDAEIVVRTSPVLTKPPRPWIPANPNSSLLIHSDSIVRTISGGNVARIFFFDAPGAYIVIRDLQLVNGRAQGGDGKHSGGGGGGLGGAIFVGAGAVALENVNLSGNAAVGGAGGQGVRTNGVGAPGIGAGGGGGLHSPGGQAESPVANKPSGGGGGGYFGNGGQAWREGGGGGGGGVYAYGASSNAQLWVGAGGGGTTNGGVGGQRNAGAGGGAGGDEGREENFKNGLAAVGWGGGGGGGGFGRTTGGASFNYYTGGSGGNGWAYGGGGGGGSSSGNSGAPGGQGGDYGGGGGAGISDFGGAQRGGNGGFGGGGGGGESDGGDGGFGGGNGARVPYDGQAGSGYGGSVFVRAGAFLIVRNATVGPGTVAPGSTGPMPDDPFGDPLDPGGSAAGDGIYVMEGAGLTYDLAGTPAVTMAGGIGGGGGLLINGPAGAITELAGANTYSGFTTVQNGALRLAIPGAVSPNSLYHIYDPGGLDIYGIPLTMTPAKLDGSTGSIFNGKPNQDMLFTLTAATNTEIPVGVQFKDGVSKLALAKTGTGTVRLTGSSTATGGTTVSQGTLELAGGNQAGLGTLNGSLTVSFGAKVNATVPNALGYETGRKISTVTLNGAGALNPATFNSPANADQGWGVAWTLHNGAVLSSNNDGNSTTTPSKFALGGPADNRSSISATGSAASEIRGRLDLRPDFSQTMVDFTVADGSTLRIPASITSAFGPVGLRKLSPGWLKLQGINTYTGGTVVEAGVLELAGGNSADIGTIFGDLTVNNNGVAVTAVPDAFGYSNGLKINAVYLNNGGTLNNAAGTNVGWGVAYVLNNGGIMTSNSGENNATAGSKFAFGGPAGSNSYVVALGTTPSEIRGRIDLRPDNGQTIGDFNVAAGAQLNIPAAITSVDPGANAVRLRKVGAGTLALSFANTYTGGTEINLGVLAISNDSALGTTGNITFTGGTLRFDGVNPDLSARLRQSGGQPLRIDTNGRNVTFDSALSGDGGFIKSGTGTLTIGGACTYTGGTSLNAGNIVIKPGGRLGSGAVNIAAGTTLDLTAFGNAGYEFAAGSVLTNNGTILGKYYWAGTVVDITVEQPANTPVNPNTTASFDTLFMGSSAAKTWTVKNTTQGSLQISGVSLSGPNAADFTLTGLPSFPLWLTPTPGTTPITFTVTFNPLTPGTKSATLRIVSNDPDESPFDITLAGTGHTPRELSVELPDGTPLPRRTVFAWGTNEWGQAAVPAGLYVQGVSGGRWHTLALKEDGTVTGWGYNDDQQVSIPAGLTGVTAVAAGGYHSAALKANGTVVVWGHNGYGQRNVPVGLSGVRAISAGEAHTLALKADGTVVAWGYNGDGGTSVPAGLNGVKAISAGTVHSAALKNDGTLVMWGRNNEGQCNIPAGLGPVKAVSGGQLHTLALLMDGTVKAWGSNAYGQCSVPAGLTNVMAIAAGQLHSMALKEDGTVVAWGNNEGGQTTVPAAVSGVASLAAGWNHGIAAVRQAMESGSVLVGQAAPVQTVIARNTGTEPLVISSVSVQGANAADFALNITTLPVTIAGLSQLNIGVTFTPGATGPRTASLRIVSDDADEEVITVPLSGSGYLPQQVAVENGAGNPVFGTQDFGSQLSGQQGPLKTFVVKNLGSQPLLLTSLTVTGAQTADFVLNTAGMVNTVPGFGQTSFTVRFMPSAMGARSALLRLTTNDANGGTIDFPLTGFSVVAADISVEVSGTALSGNNTVFAWGKNDWGQRTVPPGLTDAVAISGGRRHTLALRANGTVAAWGNNSNLLSTVPAGLTGVIAVAAGASHSAVLKADGTVVVWGDNTYGQVNIPAGLSGVTAISAGEAHTLALKTNGTVVAWGFNGFGGTSVPAGLSGVKAISAGTVHSAALKTDGTLVMWGRNDEGQCNIPAGLGPVKAVSGGQLHTLALRMNGTVAAWGNNGEGQCNVPAGLGNVIAISAGQLHSVALQEDGTIVAWGSNASGQTTVPPEAGRISLISAGWEHTLAMGAQVTFFDRSTPGVTGLTQVFLIKNRGTDPLEITGVSVTGAHAADFSKDTAGMLTNIPGGGQTTFTVTFTPSATGRREATVRVMSTDADQGTLDLNVMGMGYTPQEVVLENPDGSPLPGALTFETLVRGQSSTPRTIIVKNTGTDPLVLTGVSVTGAHPGDFPSSTAGMLTTIGALSQTSLTIRFAPTAHGARSAILRLQTNDADEGLIEIPLSGTGRIPPSLGYIGMGGQTAGVFAPQNLTTSSAPQTILLANNGAEPLEITGFSLLPGDEAAHFSLNTAGMLTTIPGYGQTTFTLTFSPLSVGGHSTGLRMVSNDPINPVLTMGVGGTGVLPRDIWRKIHFGSTANTGPAADDADWDSDGVSNLAEYAFGLNPLKSDGEKLPQPGIFFNGWLLGYQIVRPQGTSGVSYIGESSSDCETWDLMYELDDVVGTDAWTWSDRLFTRIRVVADGP